MLKNNSLLWIVYWVLFLMIFLVVLYSRYGASDSSIVFEYPKWDIDFAGDVLPMWNDSFDNKKRFDKEFLLTSNNLYQFYLYVKRYPLYIPEIEEKLLMAEIPNDLKYLPIAESALRDDVVSSAWAGWIWQFMPETAKAYGLVVNDQVDERYHFEKSTDAAISYLSDLYNMFWNWSLAAAAYNRWENGLRRDMESQNVDNYYDLYLNEETSRYVFRILAIKYVMHSYFEKKDFIDRVIWWVHEKPLTEKVSVWAIDDIAKWSMENGYNYKDVKVLNRWIVWNTLPEGNWEITILKK